MGIRTRINKLRAQLKEVRQQVKGDICIIQEEVDGTASIKEGDKRKGFQSVDEAEKYLNERKNCTMFIIVTKVGGPSEEETTERRDE
ncbi:MAG: hypothetical protein WBJ87_08560 [Candidatus Hydrothermia bacterium]